MWSHFLLEERTVECSCSPWPQFPRNLSYLSQDVSMRRIFSFLHGSKNPGFFKPVTAWTKIGQTFLWLDRVLLTQMLPGLGLAQRHFFPLLKFEVCFILSYLPSQMHKSDICSTPAFLWERKEASPEQWHRDMQRATTTYLSTQEPFIYSWQQVKLPPMYSLKAIASFWQEYL